jgi:hypothetical protein
MSMGVDVAIRSQSLQSLRFIGNLHQLQKIKLYHSLICRDEMKQKADGLH